MDSTAERHAVAMPTCHQTAAGAAMIKLGNASSLPAVMRSPSLTSAFPSSEQLPGTHRDVKELLCVVQHADPDGDVPAGGHGRRPVRGVQGADAKSLRRSETLPRSKGSWRRVRFCHGEQW